MTYQQQIEAKNADVVSIGIRYAGSSFVDSKTVRRADLGLYSVGSAWRSADGSTTFVVVNH
jgi:hypothetical protein